MKAYGDIPTHHRELMDELEALENWFYDHGQSLPPLSIAKGFTCIAHDYYWMECEEKGELMLLAAEFYCPGYFEKAILAHADKDGDFGQLVRQLKDTSLALNFMVELGFPDE